MNNNRHWLGLVFVVLSATSYAANSTSSVVAYSGGTTPLSMVSFRVTFTVIALYALLRFMSVSLAMTPRDRNISLALGILLAVYSYCLMEAFDRLPVALAVLTFYLYPLFLGIITIVDNVTRAIDLLIDESKKLSKKNRKILQKIVNDFDNKKNLTENVIQIKNNLTRRARVA